MSDKEEHSSYGESAAPRIGQILINQGHLTEERLQEALSLQQQRRQQGIRRTLGEICVAQGWCEMRHIAEAMRIQQERIFDATALGQVLIDMGVLTLGQLSEALQQHHDTLVPLATFLVERGYCTEQQLGAATEIQQIRRVVAARQQTSSLYNPFNIMESLVNELLDDVIGERHGCTCNVCRSNVFAIALNNLPTRYLTDHSRFVMVAQRTRDEYGSLIRRKTADAVEHVKRNPRPQCRRLNRTEKAPPYGGGPASPVPDETLAPLCCSHLHCVWEGPVRVPTPAL